MRVLRLRPATQHGARTQPSGPSRPLLGRCPAHRDRGQRGQTATVVGARLAREPGVHHDPYPGHRQRRLGDRGRDDHPSTRALTQHTILLGAGQTSVQGVHGRVHAGKATQGRLDLRDPRHEDQDVALVLDQRTSYGRGDVVMEDRGDPAVVGTAQPRWQRAPDRKNWMQCTGDADHRSAPGTVGPIRIVGPTEKRSRPLGFDGGRHCHQGQVLAQVGPDVDQQRQGQVGIEVALVHFVEHDGPDAGQLGIVLDPPQQQAGRDHLDARTSTGAPLSAYGVSDRLPDRFAQQMRQPTGSSAGCYATGLRDDDPPGDDVGDRGWDQGRLAGARRSVDHRDSAGAKRLVESGQARGDREVRRRGEQVAQRVGHSCSLPQVPQVPRCLGASGASADETADAPTRQPSGRGRPEIAGQHRRGMSAHSTDAKAVL